MEKKINILERLLYLTLIADEEILKARDIETRYLNYPTKRNYKRDDLERIIYGNK
jgi:hypothetical protein